MKKKNLQNTYVLLCHILHISYLAALNLANKKMTGYITNTAALAAFFISYLAVQHQIP